MTKTISVPDLGGATDVDVIEILVKPGQTIKVDMPLVTLESDKATLEVPSTDQGVVKELKVKKGDKVSTGSPILLIETSESQADSKSSQETKSTETKSSEKSPDAKSQDTKSSDTKSAETQSTEKLTQGSAQKTIPATGTQDIDDAENTTADAHAGPIVRRIAREFGVDLTKVPPTAPKGRVTKEDIQQYVKSQITKAERGSGSGLGLPEAPQVDFAKFGEIEKEPLSRIKKLSGKNLHRNWLLVPHITQFDEADITELEAFRQAQKSVLERDGIKLTPLVFVMKAVVGALRQYPQFNASLDASGENLILKKYFHIGVAVDTPDGLVVPVIRDVDKKGMIDLAKELAEVSARARKKQLSPAEMQGGCFSISSLGGIGGTAFTPIVNVPEVAILGVSKAAYKPIFEEGEFKPKLMLPLSLSYDHRVIDGADGARFIVYLTKMLADIRNLLL